MDPTQDELEERRIAREGSVAAEEAAGGGEVGEEDDGQLFVWEQGRKVTLGTLIARGIAVKPYVVFGGKRTRGEGLFDFADKPLVLAETLPSKVEVVPTRNGDGKVTEVAVVTHFAIRELVNADSERAMSMLAPIIEKRKGNAA
jgi:hypothetical protein